MKQVVLATVVENEQVGMHYCMSLAISKYQAFFKNVEISPLLITSNGNTIMARNQALTWAWENEVDGIIFVDPQMSWEPEDLFALIASDKDAVCLPVATKIGFQLELGEISRLQTDEATGEFKILGSNLEFFYLSKAVLTKLAQSHPVVSYMGAEVKLIIQGADIYSQFFSDGQILTYRLNEAGYELWINPNHTVYKYESSVSSVTFADALKAAKNQ